MARHFLLLFVGQKKLNSLADCLGPCEMILFCIADKGVVHPFIDPDFDIVVFGIFRFWPACTWTQSAHLTFCVPLMLFYFMSSKKSIVFETIFAEKIQVPPSGRATLVMAKVAKTIAAPCRNGLPTSGE